MASRSTHSSGGNARDGVIGGRTAADGTATGRGALAAAAAPVVVSAVETVTGVLEDARQRGGAAWVALRGDEATLPASVRRWPWALAAAAAGATAGAAVAYVLQRLQTGDAEDAVDPAVVQAVVDRPDPARAAPQPVPPVSASQA